MKYDPKLPLKYYRDYKKNCEQLTKEMEWFWFFIVPQFTLWGGAALIYGVMTLVDYLKGL